MSNPFAPPGPQPQQPPQPPQDPFAQPAQGQFSAPARGPVAQPGPGQFGPPVPQATYGGSGPMWAQQQPFASAPAPKGGNGLAITAIVLSGLALLSVLAMAAFIFFGSGGSGGWVLSGKVTVVDKGVADIALQDALTSAIEDDGGSVDHLKCPLRSPAGQGLVTVCHGSVDGFDWTGVVVFEDDAGTFIVTEY